MLPGKPRIGCIALTLLGATLVISACSSRSQSGGNNPFISRQSADQATLNRNEVQRSYDNSLINNHLAIVGSQLTRELIINNYIRFAHASRASASTDVLQANFTSFGYFNAPSLTARKEYCRSAGRFVGAVLVSSIAKENSQALCSNSSSSTRILLGYSLRGFAVPNSNRFARSIALAELARASQKPGGALWSDLDPGWPRRPIRWLFSSQAVFITDLRALGIKPPERYQLAATYDSAYQNLGTHRDNLLFAPTDPSLTALLQGARFRILPVQTRRGAAAIAPSPENLAIYPPQLVRGLYFYFNTESPYACIMKSFADFMIQYNQPLLSENNVIPLPAAEQRATSLALRQGTEPLAVPSHAPTLCKAYAEFAQRPTLLPSSP